MIRCTRSLGVLLTLFVAAMVSSNASAQSVGVAKPPASVNVVLAERTVKLTSTDGIAWIGNDVQVTIERGKVTLRSPTTPVKKIQMHWSEAFDPNARVLGDTWERAYGDLQWRPAGAGVAMPWYFISADDKGTAGYGVMTGPAAFCSWRIERDGVTLTADVRSGGVGVELGERTLDVCTIVSAHSDANESTFAFARRFCTLMCPHPRLPKQPVYGFNDWYCSYGKSTAKSFLEDAGTIAALAPAGDNRPYMVIDDGWQAGRQGAKITDSPWDRTNEVFGSTMADVATAIKAMHARPGLWYHPLEAWQDCPDDWRIAVRKNSLDPSKPEVLKKIADDMKRFRGWGYELVKHDFSTFEIAGRWGKDMGEDVVPDGLTFADRSKTTAEIILNFYRTLRDAAGDDMLLDGCNTISHLSAGVFELARIGDDTSGTEWKRTREMGVNALAFRIAQHNTFYAVDADCIGLADADAIPWSLNKQWLDLLVESGTPLFVSWPKRLMTPVQHDAFMKAFETASRPHAVAEPIDWLNTRTPSRWKLADGERTFDFGK